MALTRKEYTGNGSTTLYNVDFDLGYIDKNYVYVYKEGDELINQLAYTWRNENQIELTNPVDTGVKFYIRRVIPRDKLVNDYVNGAILREGNLNDSFLQIVMIRQEIEDGFISVDGDVIRTLYDIDMLGNRILNLPKGQTDAEPLRIIDFINRMQAYQVDIDSRVKRSGDYMEGVLRVLGSTDQSAAIPLSQIQTQIANQFAAYDPKTYIDYGLVSEVVGNTLDYGSIN